MPFLPKKSFTAKIEIAGWPEYRVMDFEVIGDNFFYKLSPIYKRGEEPIQQLKDIFFNRSWMARNPKNQKVVDWVKSVFEQRGLSLPE